MPTNHPEGLSDGQIEWLLKIDGEPQDNADVIEAGAHGVLTALMGDDLVVMFNDTRYMTTWAGRRTAATIRDFRALLDRKERETAEQTKGAVEFALDTLAAVASSVKVERVSPHLWTDADRAQVRLRAATKGDTP